MRTFQRKPTGRAPSWTPEQMEEAIAAYQAGASFREVHETVGVATSTLARHLRERGLPVRATGLPGVTKEQHPAWKGGRRVDRDGYIRTYAPDHPWPRRGGYVLEHVRVTELALGRRLVPEEIVHHLDHDRANNDPSNLAVMLRGAHSSHHRHGDHHKRTRDALGRFA